MFLVLETGAEGNHKVHNIIIIDTYNYDYKTKLNRMQNDVIIISYRTVSHLNNGFIKICLVFISNLFSNTLYYIYFLITAIFLIIHLVSPV